MTSTATHDPSPDYPADLAGLVSALLAGDRPFALVRRSEQYEGAVVELLLGDLVTVDRLADLPVDPAADLLALVPYRQVLERGEECRDDGAPLLALRVAHTVTVPVADLLPVLPVSEDLGYTGAFDVDDETYATSVKAVIAEEIGRGEGANFVLRRTFVARPARAEAALRTALAAFGRLLREERGAYWTFCVHVGAGHEARTGFATMVGATPERHVSVTDGVAMMNPISGTFRRPPGEATLDEVLEFLANTKEREELAMVLDEELKMMAAVSDGAVRRPAGVAHLGGRVVGPYLKEMARLAHTEYLIEANTDLDVRDVLRATMFAPTVTGSPIRNAFRVIARHETGGRGYYAGVLALIGHDARGGQTLDAPILIRAAYLTSDGTVRVPVGATLVRDSDPAGEVRETWAKGEGVMRALGIAPGGGALPPAPVAVIPVPASGPRFAGDPRVREMLRARNATLASFWLDEQDETSLRAPELTGRRVLVVDAEDAFTAMLVVELRALGLDVRLRPYQDFAVADVPSVDLLILGPGPGDPRDPEFDKIRIVRRLAQARLASGLPLLGICLGSQVTALELGLELVHKTRPFQGTQRTVDFYGRPERVGFYNTYSATAPAALPPGMEIATDAGSPESREIVAFRTPTAAGFQFHPESVLTEHGVDLLRAEIARLLG